MVNILMNNSIKTAVLIAICACFLFTHPAKAGTASSVADRVIQYTAQGAYYITKYTLKAGWFVVKKTTKGVVVVSKSAYNATKDAFDSEPKSKPINRIPENPDYNYEDGTLPPPPPIID